MSEDINRKVEEDEGTKNLNQAYMNRIFCSTKERISYILYSAYGNTTLGKYDVGHDI